MAFDSPIGKAAMPRVAKDKTSFFKDSTANLGFEAKRRLSADKLRNNMDAAEPERSGDRRPQAARRASEAKQYKLVVIGLTFLKYISDTFEEQSSKLLAGKGDDECWQAAFRRKGLKS